MQKDQVTISYTHLPTPLMKRGEKKTCFFCLFHFRKFPLYRFCRSFLISSFWNLAICTKERINLGSCCFAIQQIESLDPASRAEAMEHFTKMLEVETNCFVTFGHTFITEWMVIVCDGDYILWNYLQLFHTKQLDIWFNECIVFISTLPSLFLLQMFFEEWGETWPCEPSADVFLIGPTRSLCILPHDQWIPPELVNHLNTCHFFPSCPHTYSQHTAYIYILSWTGETQTHSRI